MANSNINFVFKRTTFDISAEKHNTHHRGFTTKKDYLEAGIFIARQDSRIKRKIYNHQNNMLLPLEKP